MTTAGRQALVTGATGGLGLTLVAALLAEGYRVRATGRSIDVADRLQRLGAAFVRADLTEAGQAERLCRSQQVVFHAAARSSAAGSRAAFEAINLRATESLVEAATASGCEHLIHVSSPSVYARWRDQIGLTEADPPTSDPLNHYARTKLAAEAVVRRASRPGFRTVVVRPRAIVGPDDRVILPALLALLRRSRVPLLRGGRALVELTDVRDVAQALILADRKAADLAGEVVNISGGRPIAVREIARLLAEALDWPLRFFPVPILVARACAWIAERRASEGEPVLTRYMIATMGYSQTFDLAKAVERLAFRPRHDAIETLLQSARGGQQ